MDTLWSSFLAWLKGWGAQAGQQAADAGAQLGDQVGAAAQQMDLPGLLALAAALGWASGFRLYAAVFLVGALGVAGWLPLPEGLQVLQHPAVLGLSGVLLFVEFFADKIPGLDSLWDLVNSVVRVPAGAALAAGVFGADSATMAVAAGLMGGTLSASSQAAKTSTRAAINTSPEPVSNLLMSFFEDGLVLGGLWLATHSPLVFGVVLVIALVLMWLVTWLLFKFLRRALARVRTLFGAGPASHA